MFLCFKYFFLNIVEWVFYLLSTEADAKNNWGKAALFLNFVKSGGGGGGGGGVDEGLSQLKFKLSNAIFCLL